MHGVQPNVSDGGGVPPIVFTSCEMLDAAHENARMAAAGGSAAGAGGASTAAKRREVSVGGRRVRTIDVHAHCIVPKTYELMGRKMEDHQFPDLDEVGPVRMAEMDAQGIDVEALSINPFWYRAEKDQAVEVVRINNQRLAECCGTYPDRIAAFASVTLQFPELAAEQLENAVKKLGLRGAAVSASCAGVDFSDPKFAPFWRKCEDLDVLVFIHPSSTPELHKRLAGNGWLANTIGNPLDTTICLEKLIFEGTLDKHPKLKLCAAHGGGFVPSYAPRMDHACRVAPDECDPSITLQKKPTE
jgi:aminocarboxymuconate-semialdehyde decarboxylase